MGGMMPPWSPYPVPPSIPFGDPTPPWPQTRHAEGAAGHHGGSRTLYNAPQPRSDPRPPLTHCLRRDPRALEDELRRFPDARGRICCPGWSPAAPQLPQQLQPRASQPLCTAGAPGTPGRRRDLLPCGEGTGTGQDPSRQAGFPQGWRRQNFWPWTGAGAQPRGCFYKGSLAQQAGGTCTQAPGCQHPRWPRSRALAPEADVGGDG